ncbi:hypothetical protein ABK040_004577 [Willaertia magna]
MVTIIVQCALFLITFSTIMFFRSDSRFKCDRSVKLKRSTRSKKRKQQDNKEKQHNNKSLNFCCSNCNFRNSVTIPNNDKFSGHITKNTQNLTQKVNNWFGFELDSRMDIDKLKDYLIHYKFPEERKFQV